MTHQIQGEDPQVSLLLRVLDRLHPQKIANALSQDEAVFDAIGNYLSHHLNAQVLAHAKDSTQLDLVMTCLASGQQPTDSLTQWHQHLSAQGVIFLQCPQSHNAFAALYAVNPPIYESAYFCYWFIFPGDYWQQRWRQWPESDRRGVIFFHPELVHCSPINTANDPLGNRQSTALSISPSLVSTPQLTTLALDPHRQLRYLQQSLDANQAALAHAQTHIQALLQSTSWRMTEPLRKVVRKVRHIGGRFAHLQHLVSVIGQSLRHHGLPNTVKKLARANWSMTLRQVWPFTQLPQSSLSYLPPIPANHCLYPRVLIVAETKIRQCLKYRVTQKQQMIKAAGYDCTVVSWEEVDQVRSLLQTHAIAIFYRVPGFEHQLAFIELAQQLGTTTFWETDDLIFDRQYYLENNNITLLHKRIIRSIIEGIPLYRAAMFACNACIASTQSLAKVMQELGIESTFVIQNGLDDETLFYATKHLQKPKRSDGLVRIVYGSGTPTHNADFLVAAPGICRVLRKYPFVRLTIIGDLELPKSFESLHAQLEILPGSIYETYLARIATCQINIAPLESCLFNDAKSNIKFLEAAILKIPSVCSHSAEYQRTIEHSVTGFLAATDDDWDIYLSTLVVNPTLRAEMGQRAHAHVRQMFTPESIGQRQVLPFLSSLDHFSTPKKRILGVNIYFSPRRFGGATIVAEQLAYAINQRQDVEYALFTSLDCRDTPPYTLRRYQTDYGMVFGMGLPSSNPILDYDNPHTAPAFYHVLRSWKPDLVHLHCIQGFGLQLLEICRQEKIPYVITLHDQWWVCPRQFMVTSAQKHCQQTTIRLEVCQQCAPAPYANISRQYQLKRALNEAAMVLAPSNYIRELYCANGVPAQQIQLNKNGVMPVLNSCQKTMASPTHLRFGYVGGKVQIKGWHLIHQALHGLDHTNYTLFVVDNELNLGRRSFLPTDWDVPGTVNIVPAYTQDTIDAFYQQIDVLLFPSQGKESFGLSVREALIRDVWVITTESGGVCEDVIDGVNGTIIPLTDQGTALQRAIAAFLDAPQRLKNYQNPYKDQIRSFGDQAAELIDLLQPLIHQTPSNLTTIDNNPMTNRATPMVSSLSVTSTGTINTE